MQREATPARDEPDPDDFGTTEGVSDQMPEEGPREAVPEGSDPDRGRDERDESSDHQEAGQ
jgi:hypothetical protein